MSALALLCLVAASQGFMLMIVLFRLENGLRLANWLLGGFIGVQTLRLFSYYCLYEEAFRENTWVYLVMNVSLAAGPLLYLYVQSLTTPGFRFTARSMLHFLPMFFFLIGATIWVNYYGWDVFLLRGWMWESRAIPNYVGGDEVYSVSVLVALIYSVLACRLLWRHGNTIRSQFSALEEIDLHWLWWILGLFMGGAVLGAIRDALVITEHMFFGPRMLIPILVSVMQIYYIAYRGLRQRQIYITEENGDVAVAKSVAETVNDVAEPAGITMHDDLFWLDNESQSAAVKHEPLAKYRKSGLTADQSAALWQQLLRFMDEEKPYLNNDLNLTQLAKALTVSNDHLTQTINIHGEQNFYDFINDYRVAAAKQRLREDALNKRVSLLHIALDCGFSSQSTFSTRFKGAVGVTPSEFRKMELAVN